MNHQTFIRRTFDLARLGAAHVSPNPMVGAVLVHNNRIIGEGWHQRHGQAHAEVNCLKNVREADRQLIPKSTLYVSLEPCCIFGRTPPCTNLILENNIKKVVISCLDLTPEVAGNGVQILRDAGVEVITGILEEEGKWLSRIRATFVTKKRPRITLKWAESKDGFIGKTGEQVWITNSLVKRSVHQLRSEVDAILVGATTAKIDNPALTTRHYFGKNPLRIVLNKHQNLSEKLTLFQDGNPTWWVNEKMTGELGATQFIQLPFDKDLLPKLLTKMYKANFSSLLVEGGATTLQHFIDQNLWDEAHRFTGDKYLKKRLKETPAFVLLSAVFFCKK